MKIGCSEDFYGQKQILPFFLTIQIDVTQKLMVLILVDIDRGAQDLYIGNIYSIIGLLL